LLLLLLLQNERDGGGSRIQQRTSVTDLNKIVGRLLLSLLESKRVGREKKKLCVRERGRMEEPAFCGVIVAVIMVGVPLWHSIREGRQGRVVKLHLARWWLACALVLVVSLIMAILLGYSAFLLSTIPPAKLSLLSTSCKIISKGSCPHHHDLIEYLYASSSSSSCCSLYTVLNLLLPILS
jgi:hypothetical protein